MQTPVVDEVSETPSPDEAVGLTANAAEDVSLDGIVPKVMVGDPGLTVNACSTAGAALKVPLPGWFAVSTQEPTPVIVTV